MSITKFTIEGEAVMGFFGSELNDRQVRIKDTNDPSDEMGTNLEQLVARSLNFPNNGEFEAMSERLSQLRDQGLQPMEGAPDIVREGTRLRITVEVVEDEDDD